MTEEEHQAHDGEQEEHYNPAQHRISASETELLRVKVDLSNLPSIDKQYQLQNRIVIWIFSQFTNPLESREVCFHLKFDKYIFVK